MRSGAPEVLNQWLKFRVPGLILVGAVAVIGSAQPAGVAYGQSVQTQEQVPIPGLTLEESVRLETARDKLQELTTQREQKNLIRRDEFEKLVKQVEEAAGRNDDLGYRAARERLISYIFAANNKDHNDLSQIVYTVKETRVLGARARIALNQLAEETGADSGLGGFIQESESAFRETFVTPNQREIVMISTLLTNNKLSPEEENRLKQYLDELVHLNALVGHWEKALQDIPYLPAQIDPLFDKKEALAFLDSLDQHLRFDYKDLEIQLFWSEVLAEVGRRYAAGKLPLVRVQSALNRLSRLSGTWPQAQGKPWFIAALDRLSGVKSPSQRKSWRVPRRDPGFFWLNGRASGNARGNAPPPDELLRQIHQDRNRKQKKRSLGDR